MEINLKFFYLQSFAEKYSRKNCPECLCRGMEKNHGPQPTGPAVQATTRRGASFQGTTIVDQSEESGGSLQRHLPDSCGKIMPWRSKS